MKLSEIIKNIKTISVVGNADVDIKDVQIDSRQVASGTLFIAVRGTVTDGHKFIPGAVESGAAAVISSSLFWERIEQAAVGCRSGKS